MTSAISDSSETSYALYHRLMTGVGQSISVTVHHDTQLDLGHLLDQIICLYTTFLEMYFSDFPKISDCHKLVHYTKIEGTKITDNVNRHETLLNSFSLDKSVKFIL